MSILHNPNLKYHIAIVVLLWLIVITLYDRRLRTQHHRHTMIPALGPHQQGDDSNRLLSVQIPADNVIQTLGHLLKGGNVAMNFSGVLVSPIEKGQAKPQYNLSGPTFSHASLDVYRKNASVHMYTTAEPLLMDSSSKRLPDCLIIGVRKGGTWPLMTFLNEHPQVQDSSPKDYFFSDDRKYSLGLEWYKSTMPDVKPGQVLIEKAAEYFHHMEVPKRVHEMNSSIKLILILRDPVQRLISDYYSLRRFAIMQQQSDWHFQELFTPLEELVYDHKRGDLNYSYGGLYRSKYIKFAHEWLHYFPREQIHVVNGDKFITDNPYYELVKVEEFLGLPSFFGPNQFQFEVSKGYWCSVGLGCCGLEKGHKHPALDARIESAIRIYLKPYNQELFDLFKTDFSWN